jgi:hypothetical protein
MKTTHCLFSMAAWRFVALLGLIPTLLVLPVLAQHHDTAANAGLQGLTFAQHVDTPFTAATATTAMTNASTVVGKCDQVVDATQDVACQVTMAVSGGIGTFGTAGDGGDNIDTDAKMNALINSGTADVMIVTLIGRCGGSGPGPGLTIIGCGNVGSRGIVSVNSLAGNLLGVEITHEFLHNQGHNHRGDAGEAAQTPGAILNPVLNLNSNIINQAECGSLHTGASYTAVNNGPIVDTPPVITCPADGTAECTTKSPSGTPETSPPILAFLAGAAATDGDAFGGVCEPAPTLSNNAPNFFPKGATAVTFTAKDVDFLGATSSCQANVRVVDTTPPSITCPAPITVECTQFGGTPASNPTITAFLAGASATDICDPSPTLANNAPGFFSLGTTTVAFKATDADLNASQCLASVNLQDTTPPVISALSASPNVLRPPNHKFVPVQLSVSVTDTCDPNPTCAVTSIASSEPPLGGGSGNTQPDFEITGPLGVSLRAERDGTGPGRTYTIMVTCSDHSNNSSQKATTVTVPHDQG